MVHYVLVIQTNLHTTSKRDKEISGPSGPPTCGPRLSVLEYDVIEENNLCQLHGDVVFVGSGLEVADHGGADAEGRDGDPGQDHGAGLGGLGVHQEEGHVLFHDAVKKTQDLQGVEDVDQSGRVDHTD